MHLTTKISNSDVRKMKHKMTSRIHLDSLDRWPSENTSCFSRNSLQSVRFSAMGLIWSNASDTVENWKGIFWGEIHQNRFLKWNSWQWEIEELNRTLSRCFWKSIQVHWAKKVVVVTSLAPWTLGNTLSASKPGHAIHASTTWITTALCETRLL